MIETINPATGEKLEEFEYTGGSEVDEKLERAVAAQKAWRRLSFSERGTIMSAAAKVLRSRTDELAATATREMGKPIAQAIAEVEKCAWCCEYYAENAATYLADEIVETNAQKSYVGFRPLGIVLAIMPWNFPYWQVFRAAAPALMAGNAMVLKHASNVSRSALEIESVFRQAGAPEGIFTTFLLKSDAIAGLIADNRIVAATLTGSEGAGMSVASAAGHALKKVVLELGGSDPFIVLADADIDAAAKVAVRARFQNNGQSCIAAKRFIVEQSVYEDFTTKFAAAAAAQVLGDPLDQKTELGPVARDDLRDALAKQISASVSAGARIVTGGKAVERKGFFYEATILADVTPSMAVFREETFGPAAAVMQAENAEHAVELANDSNFGLGGNLWTRNIDAAQKLAATIQSGNVFINGMTASDPRLPFGGIKRSGYGRELGAFGIREFVNIQTVWIGPEKAGTAQKHGAE
ncbi:MAG: NAD-dependent succinate-semialdehyde dehydrogenase [Candidatus Eremiobacteraeota bacterium]|nr:NAD-dependent succinate-semialdehyde dehydrogenase [Candidatus Eremiobacteraeota bacterium]